MTSPLTRYDCALTEPPLLLGACASSRRGCAQHGCTALTLSMAATRQAPLQACRRRTCRVSDVQSMGRWQTWSDTLAPISIPPDARFSDIIVPTKDSARYTFLLDVALKHGMPILFVGMTGQEEQVLFLVMTCWISVAGLRSSTGGAAAATCSLADQSKGLGPETWRCLTP